MSTTITVGDRVDVSDIFGRYIGTVAEIASSADVECYLVRRDDNGELWGVRNDNGATIRVLRPTYHAARDFRSARTDEDSAMAHKDIYSGDSLDDAKQALADAIVAEIEWLIEPRYRSAQSLRRAADMLDAVDKVARMSPNDGGTWSQDDVTAAGITWSITRVER